MTKDFKGGHSSAAKTSQYGVSWMLGGIAIGLLVGIAIYAFAHMSPNDANASANTHTANTTQTTDAAPATPPVNTTTDANTPANNVSLRDTPTDSTTTTSGERPGFSYHALLPEVDFTPEVPVMHEPTPAVNKKKASDAQKAQEQEATQDITRSGRYMFQVGAFKTAQQAENRRRKLQGIGLNTRVEKAEVRGQLWHRVRLGPSTDLKVVNRWQQTLQRAGLDYTKIRL